MDLQQGTDGAIYCMQLIGPQGLYRIVPTGPSGAPMDPDPGLTGPHAAPNPARAPNGTRISWLAQRAGVHSVRITDIAGRLVRDEHVNVVDPARAHWRWDGASIEGRSLPSGVYLYTIDDVDGRRVSGKIVLLR